MYTINNILENGEIFQDFSRVAYIMSYYYVIWCLPKRLHLYTYQINCFKHNILHSGNYSVYGHKYIKIDYAIFWWYKFGGFFAEINFFFVSVGDTFIYSRQLKPLLINTIFLFLNYFQTFFSF